jgi:hypothetical protein
LQAKSDLLLDVGSGHPLYRGARCLVVIILLLSVTGRMPGQAAANDTKQTTANPADGGPAAASPQSGNAPSKGQPAQEPKAQGPIHMVPFGPPVTPPKKQAKAQAGSSNQGLVQYWGGPVISNVNVVQVMWGAFVDAPSTTGLDQFFTDITSSNYFALLAEYSTVGLNGNGSGSPPGSNQLIGPGVFGGKFTISPSLCPGSATIPPVSCSINDTQIQNELVRQVNAARLPQPVQDSQGNYNTLYMIYFPPGVTIVLAAGVNSCQQFGFCAYHSNVLSGNKLPYGVFPDFGPTSGCSAAGQHCGSGTSQQNLTSASSHELAEAATDVDAGSATTLAPPLAWADQNSGEEIADFCNHNQAQVTVNSNTYTVQSMWSNMQGECVIAPPHFAVSPATTNAVPGVPFQVTVTAQSSVGFQLGNYNNTVHFTSSDGSAVLPADYTFVPNIDNGSHTFTVNLNTTGQQTVTTTDTVINGMTGSGSVDIEHNPDLTVSSSHSGSFRQGDTGDVYSLTVTNIGDRPTSGATVALTEVLPFGLTATAISGTGWTCTLQTLICSRSDALAAGASYLPVTLTVNVANNAPPTAANTVFVAGGGELNTSNDSFIDLTNVIQLPDLVVFKNHVGSFSQGQFGAFYTLTVSNFGFAPTSGTVTLTDQLPAGLTATAISGSGWSCSTPPTLSCTRSDALAANGSYSAVTITVNVDAKAPPSVTNTATVSGGGEVNTANDTATDVTAIIPPTPDLVISSTHSGNFTQGQTGATYTLTVSNVGPAATSGTASVFDNLPFDFTATAIAGPGWTCSTPSLSCSRSDVLAAFTGGASSSYPPITVTLNVNPGAFPQETNNAFVSGGGEANTGNDGASDLTVINQLPDLVVSQSVGQVLAQGLNGATYNLTASNISVYAPTSGAVTVVDTLPSSLTATAISGSGWNCTLGNLTCTRTDSLGPNANYPMITLTVNVATNAPSSVANTVTVSGGGEIVTSDDTSAMTSPVLPPIGIMPFNTTQTVKAGNSASFLLGVNAPLPGSVTVACSSGLPPGAACFIAPASFTAPFNAPVSITVTTTSALGFAQPWRGRRAMPLYAALVACLGLVAMRAGKSRRGARLGVFCTLVLTLCSLGCGGGGSSTPPRVATPPGTYTVTVTANNATANTQASTPLTLTVQ